MSGNNKSTTEGYIDVRSSLCTSYFRLLKSQLVYLDFESSEAVQTDCYPWPDTGGSSHLESANILIHAQSV